MTHKLPQGIDAGFKLSDDQRLSLYTLMHQWSRNTDLQFNQVISWVEEATQLALAAAPPDPRKDLALAELVAKWEERCDSGNTGMRLSDAKKEGQRQLIIAGQALAYATCASELKQQLAEMRGAKR